MKSALITGGTGAFGQAFTEFLLNDGVERVVVYSRNEFNQHLMAQKFKKFDKELRFMIGDVRDRDRLRRAMSGVQAVFHAAALKRIEVGHYNPIEMVKTNIDGAINVIEAAQDAGVERVIALSSDKAFQPVSPYGQTKALAECLFLNANHTTGWKGPRFAVCRYGNVWKSTGSVFPVWMSLKLTGKTSVPVTDPECTRFFMKMNEAVDLVIDTYHKCGTQEANWINIPTLPAYRLGDLAEAMHMKMEILGLPAWEKRHESMAEGNSSNTARRMTVDELRREL